MTLYRCWPTLKAFWPFTWPNGDGNAERNVSHTTRHERRKRADIILAHVEAAKARKSGKNLAGMTADELIADLLAHRA